MLANQSMQVSMAVRSSVKTFRRLLVLSLTKSVGLKPNVRMPRLVRGILTHILTWIDQMVSTVG